MLSRSKLVIERLSARSYSTAEKLFFYPDASKPRVNFRVNGRSMTATAGSSVLQAIRENHVYVPSLCYHPRLSVVGQCRVCLVESRGADGTSRNVCSCSTAVTEGMDLRTNTEQLRASVRDNLTLLRCKHPNSCMNCEANGHCEFQNLVYRYDAQDVLPSMKSPRSELLDLSSHAIVRDMSKCVLCTRCIRACSELQGMDILHLTQRGADSQVHTYLDLPISQTACISCGQCSAVCPVGAIIERPSLKPVQQLLSAGGEQILVAQTAPAVRVAISEEFDLPPGTVSTGKLVSALRMLGFHYVFDTNFTADLTIMEEADEFATRLINNRQLPMFTSCCPGWINLVEKVYPALLPHLSTCKSPQGMMSALVKKHFAQKIGVTPDRISIVSIMPCVAKKDEIKRPQLYFDYEGKRLPETDYVLTTRELGRLIERERLPFTSLDESAFDNPLGESTGAAALFGATGGVMEAALRTAHFNLLGRDLEQIELTAVRDLALAGHTPEIREATVRIGDQEICVAVVTGSKNIRRIIERVLAGEKRWQLIEVMACPGGCIGGGGEPKNALDPAIITKRIQAIHSIDAASKIRMSHHNPSIQKLYEQTLRHPNSKISHSLLHTHYTDRSGTIISPE